MPYFVETFDHLDRESLRHTEREKHLAFLAEHADKLIACGAKLNDDGSEKGGGIETLLARTPGDSVHPLLHGRDLADIGQVLTGEPAAGSAKRGDGGLVEHDLGAAVTT
jgi:hypothetical protein